jgi:hypothetical protein
MEKGCIQRKILGPTSSHSVISSSDSVQISTVAKEPHASYTFVLYFLRAKVIYVRKMHKKSFWKFLWGVKFDRELDGPWIFLEI